MKIHEEERIETTKIVEATLSLEEVQEALLTYYYLREYGSPFFQMDNIETCVREYDANISAPSVTIYGWKTSQNGEY